MEIAAIQAQMNQTGWVLFESQLPKDFCQTLANALDSAIAICAQMQSQNLGTPAAGTAHHLLGQDPAFTQFLSQTWLDQEIRTLLDGPYILNSYGGVANPPTKATYVHHIHRDQRTYTPDFRLMLNMLVMLDDFKAENGATWLLTGSHLRPETPSPESFFAQSKQIEAAAGSLLLFDSRLWHAAGQNHTHQVRRGLTLTWSRPFLKPQFDYLNLYTHQEQSEQTEYMKQILGFYARVPKTLMEWYQPASERHYRPGQG
jgi:ectoine hydroxylase-related dioxygenase (phytanoyl-CoA dioxygenase family)